jgi:hypothetical protein
MQRALACDEDPASPVLVTLIRPLGKFAYEFSE